MTHSVIKGKNDPSGRENALSEKPKPPMEGEPMKGLCVEISLGKSGRGEGEGPVLKAERGVGVGSQRPVVRYGSIVNDSPKWIDLIG
ncbi:hypothetical protein AVEN_186018-1 [Araneus ventricosus]|uniref:Uncharacterized protein n=1 Tax=Araneus ventricosus TaxID=182803 RepID=A0A4Y2J5F4_ARAVE|nr:hypothetical protein AVEN_186018-1 [Araneus ventricosus]